MTSLINQILHSYGYFAVFGVVGFESIGLPLPGETTLIAAALYAGTTHHLSIWAVFLVAAAAAVLGDNIGYWLGRRGGRRFVGRFGRYVRLDAAKLEVFHHFYQRHGGKVVFFGRFVSVVRTYAAFFAGLNRMNWRRFLAFNAGGGILWAAVCAFGAYALGSTASSVGSIVTFIGIGIAALLAVVTSVAARRSMRRLEEQVQTASERSTIAELV